MPLRSCNLYCPGLRGAPPIGALPVIESALYRHDCFAIISRAASGTHTHSWYRRTAATHTLSCRCMQVGNAAAVTRFALRGPGSPGPRPVGAPLSDPTAVPAMQYEAAADAGLRHVAHALLAGVDAKQASPAALQVRYSIAQHTCCGNAVCLRSTPHWRWRPEVHCGGCVRQAGSTSCAAGMLSKSPTRAFFMHFHLAGVTSDCCSTALCPAHV